MTATVHRTDPRIAFLTELWETAVASIGYWAMEVEAADRTMTVVEWDTDSEFSPERTIDLALLTRALKSVTTGPVPGMSEDDRLVLVEADRHNDADGVRADLASVLVQVGLYSGVRFPRPVEAEV